MIPKKSKRVTIFLILLLLCLPVFWPLLRGDSLPCTHDNALHYYRITAMRDALRHGWLFSRWVPNLALAYGYPFFNFREPLPYLLGEVLYVAGLPLPLVLGLIYAGSLLAAAWGAYRLALDLFGERAAWVAAVSYGLGPYLLLDVMRRGNMTESIALALLPWLLWVFRRLVVDGGWRAFVASVVMVAALFLSHNISSLIFAPFLGGYVLLLACVYRERKHWPWAFVAVALALALTAWFWLPALMEQDTVQLHLSRTTRNNDFHYNFITWRELLFSDFIPYDPEFLNAPMRVPLGFARWVLALVGLGVGLWQSRRTTETDAGRVIARERRLTLIFFALVAGVYLWMGTSMSVRLWDLFPLLSFVQFPWRLVGRALLPVALLGGTVFATAPEPRAVRLLPLVERPRRYGVRAILLTVVAVLVLFAYPHAYPPKGTCSEVSYPGMASVYAFENAGWMGVDPESSYFPVWVEEHPDDMSLAEAWMRGEEPERFDVASLPEGGQLLEATYHPLRAKMRVSTPVAFRARWLGLYYPGWRVTVDGISVEVSPEDDTGLLTFPISAGEHVLEVAFGPTPLRRVANRISASALAACLLSLIWLGRRHLLVFHDLTERLRVYVTTRLSLKAYSQVCLARARFYVTHLSGRACALLGLALVLWLGKVLIIDRVPNPIRRSRLLVDDLPEVQAAMSQPFDAGLTLLGYTIMGSSLPADGELQVDLLWRAHAIPQREYRVVVLLVGEDGQSWSPAGTLRPRGYEPTPPTTMWLPGQYGYDPHLVSLLPGTPPGTYRVVVSLFDKDTLTPASLLGSDGTPLGPELMLGTVRVLRPQVVPDLETLGVSDEVHWRCGALGLLAVTLDRQVAAPGDLLSVRWVWELATADGLLAPAEPLTATLRLYDDQATMLRAWDLSPSTDWWPTNLWAGGERWVGRHPLHLPAGLQSGPHRMEVLLPGCDVPLGTLPLDIVAPSRSWMVPADFEPLSVVFGSTVRLAGYTLAPSSPSPGDTVQVQLAWQAIAEMTESYRVFVHLVGPDGLAVVQSDGVPVDWSRPTTGWMADEVIAETRALTIPPDAPAGEYHVRVGLYLLNGPRLSLADGADAFSLATLDVR